MKKQGRVLSFRTKAEVIMLVGLLICMSVVSVMSVTRTITDSSDNIETFIKNSNGNYWEATGSNIQLAIDDLTTGNDTVWVPSGNYTIDTLWINESGVRLVGQGSGGWGYDTGATIFYSTTNNEMLNITSDESKTGILIQDIKFLKRDRTVTGDGITIKSSHTMEINRCSFSKINGSAIKIIDACYSLEISSCSFRWCGTTTHGSIYDIAPAGETTDASITTCVFEIDYYASIESENGNQFIITDNFFEGATDFPTTASIYGNFGYTTISNNYFYDIVVSSTAFAIRFDGDFNVISNNVIGGYMNGIQIWTNADYNVISKNTIRNIANYGIDIRGKGTSVEGNNLYGNANAYAGIYCTSTNNSIIDNHVGKWKNNGIWLSSNAHKCLVSGNYLYDNEQEFMNICVKNEGNYNQITNNYLDPRNVGITDTGTDTVIFGNYGWDYDSLQDDKIWTSSGHYYPETEAGLQDAIDVLTTGGTVYLSECNISISNIIELDDDINLIGVGKASVLFLPDGINKDVIQINGRSNILISNICIHANGDAQTDNSVSCIDITGTSRNITIRDSYFYEGSKSLIDCQENTYNILIESCHFDGKKNCGYGGAIWFSGKDCIARNNFIKDTFGCGIVMEGEFLDVPASNCIIDGNIITGEISHGIHMEGRGGGGQTYARSNNGTIINNIIYSINSTAYVATESHWSEGIIVAENSTCRNNIIFDVQKYAIYVNEYSQGTIISENKIHDIDVVAINAYANGCTINGNQIYDVRGTYAIYTAFNDVTISGNEIEDIPNGYAIYATATNPASNVNIFENTIIDCLGSHVIWVKNYDGATITDNNIDGVKADRDAIHFEDGTNGTIIGNRIIDDGDCGDGIDIDASYDCIVMGNRVFGCVDGIDDTGTCNWNIYIGNNVRGCTNSITNTGGNDIKANNAE